MSKLPFNKKQAISRLRELAKLLPKHADFLGAVADALGRVGRPLGVKKKGHIARRMTAEVARIQREDVKRKVALLRAETGKKRDEAYEAVLKEHYSTILPSTRKGAEQIWSQAIHPKRS